MSNTTVTQVGGEENENWYIDASIKISLPEGMTGAELSTALTNNRQRLESLKDEYWHLKITKTEEDRKKTEEDKKNKGRQTSPASTAKTELDRRVEAQKWDLKILVNAIEAQKYKLALKGESYPISPWDREHPEAAARRFARAAQPAPASDSSSEYFAIGCVVVAVIIIGVLIFLVLPR